MCLVTTILVLFVEPKCPSEVPGSKLASFRVHYVRGPTDTVGVTRTHGTELRARHEFGGSCAPRPP